MSWLLRSITATLLLLAFLNEERDPQRLNILAWLTCGASFYCAGLAFRRDLKGWTGVLLGAGLLYNPLMLARATDRIGIWQLLGGSVAVALLASLTPVTNPREQIPRAKASFFVGALLVLLGYIGVELYWFTRLATMAIPAKASVEDVFDDEAEQNDGHDLVAYSVGAYRFEVHGRQFRGSTKGSRGAWKVGDSIDIEYDRDNPGRNRAAGDRGLPEPLLMVGVATLLFALWIIREEHLAVLRGWWSDRTQR